LDLVGRKDKKKNPLVGNIKQKTMSEMTIIFDFVLLVSFFLSLYKVIKESNISFFFLLSLFTCFAINLLILSFLF